MEENRKRKPNYIIAALLKCFAVQMEILNTPHNSKITEAKMKILEAVHILESTEG